MEVRNILKYYKPIEENGVIHSIDMLRLKLTFWQGESVKVKNPKWTPFDDSQEEYIVKEYRYASDKLLEDLQSIKFYMQGIDTDYWETRKEYKYRHLITVKTELSSITIGLGWNCSGKTDMSKGYVEFNPNKVCDTQQFILVMKHLRLACKHMILSRYDLAIDFPVKRVELGLIKDFRKYSYEMNSLEDKTEYLGQRNKIGRVKLYNKTIESNLDYDLTRLEVTVGSCDFAEIQALIPSMTGLSECAAIDELTSTDKVLVELIRLQDDKEIYYKKLGRRKAEKLRPYILGENTTYDVNTNVLTKIESIITEFVY